MVCASFKSKMSRNSAKRRRNAPAASAVRDVMHVFHEAKPCALSRDPPQPACGQCWHWQHVPRRSLSPCHLLPRFGQAESTSGLPKKAKSTPGLPRKPRGPMSVGCQRRPCGAWHNGCPGLGGASRWADLFPALLLLSASARRNTHHWEPLS